MGMRTSRVICIIVTVVAFLAWPIAAVAGDDIELMEFGAGKDGYWPAEGRYSPPWVAILFGPILVVLVLAPAFKDARRSHLN